MAKSKRLTLSDSSLNRYGFRVLTEGGRLEPYKKNPVMIWLHYRDQGSPVFGDRLPIGHLEDLEINGDELSGVPVFDDVDELSKTIHAKYDAGTINAASIGYLPISTSSDKKHLVPGQTHETVTEWELLEVSLVDIPANGNAVRLYSRNAADSSLSLSTSPENIIPLLTNNSDKQMKMNAAWKALVAFLGLAAEVEITPEELTKVNSELERLTSEQTKLAQELEALKAEKLTLTGSVNTLTTERDALKEKETKLTSDLAAANEQIAALKGKPAEGSATVAPKGELNATDSEAAFLKFCEEHKGDTLAIAAEMERLKLA